MHEPSSSAFVAAQRRYWQAADARHFAWQTENPVLAASEAALLAGLRAHPPARLLEIGCGEGGNLYHLRDLGGTHVGVDASLAKAAFARAATAAAAAAADASALPFADASFDAVLIRDLLHHVPERGAVLAEARRVLVPGGRLLVVEPNARAPLVLLQAALIPAERGVLRSTEAELRRLLVTAGLRVVRHWRAQPLPIERVLLHPRLGRPSWASSPLATRALDLWGALTRRLVPSAAWTYLVFEAERPVEGAAGNGLTIDAPSKMPAAPAGNGLTIDAPSPTPAAAAGNGLTIDAPSPTPAAAAGNGLTIGATDVEKSAC